MKIAVTGGTGFIGTLLIERLLQRGDTVTLLCRSPAERQLTDHTNLIVFEGDLIDPHTDLDSFVKDADIMFHCAGEIRDRKMMHLLHVAGTKRLVEASRGKVRAWVQLSSVGAYGPRQTGIVTERTPLAPEGVYEVTKTQSDMIVMQAAEEGAFRARILRPANVIGKTMTNRSFAQFIRAIEKGHFLFIGPRGATTNYLAVDNLIEALIACTSPQKEPVEIFNLADTSSLECIVGAICKGLDKPLPRWCVPILFAKLTAQLFHWIPGFPLTMSRVRALSTRVVYDSNEIRDRLGFKPLVSIEAYAEELAACWKQNHDHT